MKYLALVLIASCMVSTASNAATSPRDIGIFADAAGTTVEITGVAFTPFFFYVVGFDRDGQVKGWELSVSLDPSAVVLARVLDQESSLNVGNLDNFIVGSGGCFPGAGAYVFVTYNVGYFIPVTPQDVPVCIGAATPSTFQPAVPGYLQCDGSLVAFVLAQNPCLPYPAGCAMINSTNRGSVVPTETSSFGSVKAKF